MATIEDALTSKSNSVRQELIDNKDEKAYRHAYADESLNLSVATQIKVLREQRAWTQERLANEAGMQQPMISRYENVNYSVWSVKTLKKLAEALDVVLEIRFRSFGDLVKRTESFRRETLEVPSFHKDPFFQEPKQAVNERGSRIAAFVRPRCPAYDREQEGQSIKTRTPMQDLIVITGSWLDYPISGYLRGQNLAQNESPLLSLLSAGGGKNEAICNPTR